MSIISAMIYTALKSSSLFRELGEEQLVALSEAGTTLDVPADYCLFREGDAADCLYVVLEGRIQIYKQLEDGSELRINSLSSGAVVGEMALIDSSDRSASAISAEPCKLYTVDHTTFLALLSTHPQLAAELVAIMTTKLREADTVRAQETFAKRALQSEIAQQQGDEYLRRRLEEELRVACLIQQSLLPQNLPNLPGWQIGVHYEPAREIGGDIYDFVYFEDGRVGFVIGDASDKSIPAALVMSTMRSTLRYAAEQMVAPGAVLERTNSLLHNDIPERMFVTCLYAVLDPKTGLLQYANAGHDLPFRRTKDDAAGKTVIELYARGMPLGLLPDMHYEEKETLIEPGDQLLFYSDGLAEAHNADGEMFGFPRIQELMQSPPTDIKLIDYLLAQLSKHVDAARDQEDDITLLTLERLA